MLIYGTCDYLGITQKEYKDKNGNLAYIHHLVVLGDVETLKFYLSDELVMNIKNMDLKKMDSVKICFNVQPQITVNNKGFANESVSLHIVALEKNEVKK